ncbi:hypothetical protein H9Q70_006592 [Fusarium xylarioides]|nr:hypothetical protein H9Q70_006592 [Fusarium xylarioides]KAG5780207.1 hypothetical protein H9Q73_006162 [Fusarium xylarioides]
MPSQSQPPTRSASRAQLYIVVNRFSSYEDLGLPPDNFFFRTRNLWSIATQGPYGWRMQQGLLVYGDPCTKITRDRLPVERPDRQLLYFEVASFESDLQEYAEHILRFTSPEDADDTLECNRKWVRDVLEKLVTGGIVSREKAYDVLCELEMSSKEIEILEAS